MPGGDYFGASARTRSMRTTSSQSAARASIAAPHFSTVGGAKVSQAENDARHFYILLLGPGAVGPRTSSDITVESGEFGTAIRAEPDRAMDYCNTGN